MGTQHEVAGAFIEQNRSRLATAIVERFYGIEPGTWFCNQTPRRRKGFEDVEYHLSFLAEALVSGDPSLFLEYSTWCKVLFTGLAFSEETILATFSSIRDVLAGEMPPGLTGTVNEFLEQSIAHIAVCPSVLPSFIPDEAPLATVATAYIQALLKGNRAQASALVMAAMEAGAGVKDIYLRVFQPSQLEIGRLWQTNRISVAQEHYCTAATQMIMSLLFPYLFATEKKGKNLVMTCVGGELHEIGARMVADFFELDGWDTYFLGANAPANSIVRAIADRKADLLAVSATLATHVHLVGELVTAVREAYGPEFKIMVGGYPFNVMPTLWQKIGADGYAPDAQGAVETGNRLVAATS